MTASAAVSLKDAAVTAHQHTNLICDSQRFSKSTGFDVDVTARCHGDHCQEWTNAAMLLMQQAM